MVSKDISEGVNLFNEDNFFAAHDYFEDLWMEAEQENRLFYQGMVQVSVGSYHLINKNYKGALSQYRKGSAKLENYIHCYMDVNIDRLLENIKVLITDLELHFSDGSESIDIEKIPKIEYNRKN